MREATTKRRISRFGPLAMTAVLAAGLLVVMAAAWLFVDATRTDKADDRKVSEKPPQLVPFKQTARDVTPPDVTPGPIPTGPLFRVIVPVPEFKKVDSYEKVQVVNVATLQAGEKILRLRGIAEMDARRKCVDGDLTWPCGAKAQTALRLFIRGRPVRCLADPDAPEDSDRLWCKVGGRDISDWILRRGWAKPSPDANRRFINLADEARRQKRGLWRVSDRW